MARERVYPACANLKNEALLNRFGELFGTRMSEISRWASFEF